MNMESGCTELLGTTASLQVSKSDVYLADSTLYQTVSVAVAKVHFLLDLGPCIWTQ
jgi:hypothetical protein